MTKEALRAQLKLLKLSRRQAGVALGVSTRQVFYYLNGTHEIPPTIAILMTAKLSLKAAIDLLNEMSSESYHTWTEHARLRKLKRFTLALPAPASTAAYPTSAPPGSAATDQKCA